MAENLENIFDVEISKEEIKLNDELYNIYNINDDINEIFDNMENQINNINTNVLNNLHYILYLSKIKKIPQAEEILNNIETRLRYNYSLDNIGENLLNLYFFILQDKIQKRKENLKFIESLNFKNIKEKDYKNAIINYLEIKNLLDSKTNILNNFSEILEIKIKEISKNFPLFNLIIENDNEIKELFNNNNMGYQINILKTYINNIKKPNIEILKPYLYELNNKLYQNKSKNNKEIQEFETIIKKLNLSEIKNNNSIFEEYDENMHMNMHINMNGKKKDEK